MKTMINLVAFTIVLGLLSCATQPEFDTTAGGRIAFGVSSHTSNSHSFDTDLAIGFTLTNLASGEHYPVYFPFVAGDRIEYLTDLPAGRYVVKQYSQYMHGKRVLDPTVLEPELVLDVVAHQTLLFPFEVLMSAIYPVGGLTHMPDSTVWTALIN